MIIKLIKIFKALSDKNRLRILLMLSRKSLCVCEIKEILNISVSTVSKHLSMLKDIGLVVDEKDGKWVNYMINSTTKDATVQQFILMLPMWLNDDELIASDLAKVQNVDRNNICKI